MNITPIICTQCGSSISFSDYPLILKCAFCGTSFLTNFSDAKAQTSIKPNSDNPTGLQISKISQPVLYYTSVNQLQKYLVMLSILSFHLKQEFVCAYSEEVRCSCYQRYDSSFEARNQKSHPIQYRNPSDLAKIDSIENSLNTLGFDYKKTHRRLKESQETRNYGYYVSENDFIRIWNFCGVQKITPESYKVFWNEEVNATVQRMLRNEVVSQISDTICKRMIKKEQNHVQNKNESLCRYIIKVTSSGVEDFAFHAFGFDNLTTPVLFDAFCITLLVKISSEFNSHWMLEKLLDGEIQYVLETTLKKQYKAW